MAGATMVLASVVSTAYPVAPQLDTNESRGAAAAVHMTPLGPAIFVSIDGLNDHAKLDPASPALSIAFSNPYYTQLWARLAVPGAATIQLVIEEI